MRRRASLPYLVLGALLAGLALQLGVASVAGWRGEVRYAGLPTARLPLPTPLPPREREVPPLADAAAAPPPAGPAVTAAPPLPDIAGLDGPPVPTPTPTPPPRPGPEPGTADAPGRLEARDGPTAPRSPPPALPEPRQGGAAGEGSRAPAPPDPPARRQVAVLVTGLGLAQVPSEAVLRLPRGVSLAVSPYADDAPGWLARVRHAGHDALLLLPVEPADPARADPGPRAIGVRQDPRQRQAVLDWLLARGSGLAALAGEAGAFAAVPDAWAPVAKTLAARRLGFVELGGERLAGAAKAAGVPYLAAGPPVDEPETVAGIDAALARLEAEAGHRGRPAVAWARLRPLTLARLAAWAESLPGKGLSLTPVTALLRKPSDAGAAGR